MYTLKTLKAISLGYLLFKVNGVYFYCYDKAQDFANILKKKDVSISFTGWNVFYAAQGLGQKMLAQPVSSSWRGFYLRAVNPIIITPGELDTLAEELDAICKKIKECENKQQIHVS